MTDDLDGNNVLQIETSLRAPQDLYIAKLVM